jgi:hypothetical protein
MNMKPSFQIGQIVYDKRGNSAVYEREVDGGHLVFPEASLGWGDDDFTLDRTKWPEVFVNPPVQCVWPPVIVVAAIVAVFVLGAFA